MGHLLEIVPGVLQWRQISQAAWSRSSGDRFHCSPKKTAVAAFMRCHKMTEFKKASDRIARMRWEVRGQWYNQTSSKQPYDDREKAYKAFDAMVRSDPAWLELYEIEDGKEPKRLRRYELPRMVGKRGRR